MRYEDSECEEKKRIKKEATKTCYRICLRSSRCMYGSTSALMSLCAAFVYGEINTCALCCVRTPAAAASLLGRGNQGDDGEFPKDV